MKLLRLIHCFSFLLVQFLWQGRPLHASPGDFHRLRSFSPKKLEEFAKNVRQNLEYGNLNLRVKVRLYEPLKSDSQKFGEILYRNSSRNQKVRAVFGDRECKVSHYKGQITKSSNGESFQINVPLFDDLLLTPQDLLLSFSWNDSYEYFGEAKVAGRPVHQFIRYEKDSINGIEYASILAFVDIKYMIILQIDFLNDVSIPVRRLSVGSFKNFDGIWMPKIVEIMDLRGHRRTKLEILSVEMEN
ncbi:MAG: outer membrane lipoprotein-sorting protein [Puniceicoccales bacterium]|nr:outer membrane lipoprotein-sorting protein [Puniceicoccales bacterium]